MALPGRPRPVKELDVNNIPPEHLATDAGLRLRDLLSPFTETLKQAAGACKGGVTRPNEHYAAKDELDDAIASVLHVLDNNHLPDSDRDSLSSDINQLRRMREAYDRHEIRGAHD